MCKCDDMEMQNLLKCIPISNQPITDQLTKRISK